MRIGLQAVRSMLFRLHTYFRKVLTIVVERSILDERKPYVLDTTPLDYNTKVIQGDSGE